MHPCHFKLVKLVKLAQALRDTETVDWPLTITFSSWTMLQVGERGFPGVTAAEPRRSSLVADILAYDCTVVLSKDSVSSVHLVVGVA